MENDTHETAAVAAAPPAARTRIRCMRMVITLQGVYSRSVVLLMRTAIAFAYRGGQGWRVRAGKLDSPFQIYNYYVAVYTHFCLFAAVNSIAIGALFSKINRPV